MTLALDLPNWPAGLYDVRVVKGSASGVLSHAFSVVKGGSAHLETNLVVPSAVGFNIPIKQTIWIEYKNTGDLPMPAPLLRVHGDHDASITADPALAIPFRGFGGAPAGVTDTVEVVATGTTPLHGFCNPGRPAGLPSTYIGLAKPSNYPAVRFSLETLTSGDARTIDWVQTRTVYPTISYKRSYLAPLLPAPQGKNRHNLG